VGVDSGWLLLCNLSVGARVGVLSGKAGCVCGSVCRKLLVSCILRTGEGLLHVGGTERHVCLFAAACRKHAKCLASVWGY
jgi:hypothetical protein